MPPSAPLYLFPAPTPSESKPDIEKELKLITPDGSSEPFDLFADALQKNEVSGIHLLKGAPPQRLIARQLDTSDQFLRRNGISLRIRGSYTQSGEMITPDINIKTKKPNGEFGMSRGEYEDNIDNAGVIDLSVIEKKYASKLKAGKLPDLRNALDLISGLLEQNKIIEHFLIDTQRTRRVIALDQQVFGFDDDKRFVGEMLNDKVRYHVRSQSLQETRQMTVTPGRRELELEPLHVPCEYNKYDGCEEHVCRNLDEEDEDLSLLFFREAVEKYATLSGRTIEDAKLSKSGRGFEGWKQHVEFVTAVTEERTGFNMAFKSASSGLILPPHLDSHKAPLIVHVPNINVPWGLKAA